MIATVNETLKFLGVTHREGKNGAFQLVELVDLTTYDKFEFFKRDTLVLDGITNGDNVDVTIEISRRGYNTNVDLSTIRKSTVK